MSDLKHVESTSEFFPDDYGTRHFAGTARCVTHGRECPADPKRRVYFCARCGVEQPLETWLDGKAEASRSR